MARGSMAERFAELEGAADKTMGRYAPAAQPTELHRRCIHLMVEILDLGDRVDRSNVPAPLLAMARMLRSMEEELAIDFANVPEAAVRAFMTELRDKLTRVLATDAPGARSA